MQRLVGGGRDGRGGGWEETVIIESSRNFHVYSFLRGDSAISVALYSGNITLMEMLLDYGADIEIANKDGQTPIIRTKNTLALRLEI